MSQVDPYIRIAGTITRQCPLCPATITEPMHHDLTGECNDSGQYEAHIVQSHPEWTGPFLPYAITTHINGKAI